MHKKHKHREQPAKKYLIKNQEVLVGYVLQICFISAIKNSEEYCYSLLTAYIINPCRPRIRPIQTVFGEAGTRPLLALCFSF